MMTLCTAVADLSWSEILWVTLIGVSLVFCMLVLLIFVMKLFGAAFTSKHKRAAKTDGNVEAKEPQLPQMVSDETVAAIIVALKLYRSDIHIKESDILTIQTIKRTYSPWNSKILSLTQLPERK